MTRAFVLLLLGASFAAGTLDCSRMKPSPAPPPPGVLLENLTWIEAEKRLGPATVVVIPIGAAAKAAGPRLARSGHLAAGTARSSASSTQRRTVALACAPSTFARAARAIIMQTSRVSGRRGLLHGSFPRSFRNWLTGSARSGRLAHLLPLSMKIIISDDLPASAVSLLQEVSGFTVDARSGRPKQDLINDIACIAGAGGFKDPFRKDCTDLSRRISLLSYLIDEIDELGSLEHSSSSSSSPPSSSSFTDLSVALRNARSLLLVARSSDFEEVGEISDFNFTIFGYNQGIVAYI